MCDWLKIGDCWWVVSEVFRIRLLFCTLTMTSPTQAQAIHTHCKLWNGPKIFHCLNRDLTKTIADIVWDFVCWFKYRDATWAQTRWVLSTFLDIFPFVHLALWCFQDFYDQYFANRYQKSEHVFLGNLACFDMFYVWALKVATLGTH